MLTGCGWRRGDRCFTTGMAETCERCDSRFGDNPPAMHSSGRRRMLSLYFRAPDRTQAAANASRSRFHPSYVLLRRQCVRVLFTQQTTASRQHFFLEHPRS